MDQLKQIGRFIWTYRFWFSMGLVLIFAILTYPSGASRARAEAKRKQIELDSVFTSIKNYTNRNPFPNPRWVDSVKGEEAKLDKVTETVWEKMYRQQEKLMVWPRKVSKEFAGRLFGSDLTDPIHRNTLLLDYRRAYEGHALDDIFPQLGAIEVKDDGKVTGVVDSGWDVLRIVDWQVNRVPVSMEAWMAQEDLWVQAAIYRAIAKANKGAATWDQAAIRRLNSVVIGPDALDARVIGTPPQLVDPLGQTTPAPGSPTAGAASQGLIVQRYIAKTAQYRVIPVFVSLVADQMKVSNALIALSEADFSFTINQVNMGLPAVKIEIPSAILDSAKFERGTLKDPVFNCVQLDVWGTMRLYEAPPSIKAEQDEKEKQRQAAKPAETKPGDAKPAEAKPG